MGRAQVVVAVALGLAVLAPAAAAQEATPAGLPVTPDPAECMVAPRPLEDFAALIGTPVPAPLENFERPRGEPADPETTAAVTATVRELVACFNAGDWPRAAALYTDAGFAEDFARTTVEDLDVLAATPQAIPEMGRVALITVRDIETLPDDRVGAVVMVGAEGTDDTVYFLYFAQENGRWLVDSFVDEYDEGMAATPAAGTPATS